MKLLHFDIETRPAKVYVWSIWKPHIDVDQIIEPTSVLCFAALWHGDSADKVIYRRAQRVDSADFREMVRTIHKLLSEADAVCTFNGDSFDLPMLNQEFARLGFGPVPPIPSIDLKTAFSENFRLVSNRLKFGAPYFLGRNRKKVEHEGWPLWIKCLEGDSEAWARMREYNIGDVTLMPDLYEVLRPFIKRHPNMGLYVNGLSGVKYCTKCGSGNVEQRGWRKTQAYTYPRFYCRSCKGWSIGRKCQKGAYVPELKGL